MYSLMLLLEELQIIGLAKMLLLNKLLPKESYV